MKKGLRWYTVKSGYYQWCQSQPANDGVQQSKGWNKIWNLEVPHKIKVFLWRFCRNTLPIRILLRGRGVPAPIVCSMCTGEVEHLRHLFFECGFAKECWQQKGFDSNVWDIESSHEWLLHTLANGPDEILVKMVSVLWGVWFARNKRIFENRFMSPATVMAWSAKQILEWQIANKKVSFSPHLSNRQQGDGRKWQVPEQGCLKINVDASVVDGQNSFGIGMVLRNHQGHYITGKKMRFAGSFSVMEAEMTGITEALTWAQNYTNAVVIESDSLLSVEAIQNGQENLLELGDLIHQCRNILRHNDRLKLNFVRKQANKVAHSIARIPCELNSSIVISSPPFFLLETILSESLAF
ncbi:hypothetical protein DCAR_0521012 [Daucus carota subsp. sativus]|uniref:RNase H type-1 domain-containing protein n=1 Tax=Daucus carota subsp. sativus TaxID=79200 RepID=A0AAF1B207_DAUCS|nr:hypothetical protein DCAR_0521012 [Daucus carota subsp. sativus]